MAMVYTMDRMLAYTMGRMLAYTMGRMMAYTTDLMLSYTMVGWRVSQLGMKPRASRGTGYRYLYKEGPYSLKAMQRTAAVVPLFNDSIPILITLFHYWLGNKFPKGEHRAL